MKLVMMVAAAGLAVAGCSNAAQGDEAAGGNVSLRNLAASEVAAPAPERLRVQGTLIPTPSDPQSRHFLLRERRAIGGNIIAILREERGGRVAYARTEVDCARRLFHVVGVGSSRATAEVATADDGPLRSMAGLPLREELGGYICKRAGTPLAADAQRG
jgi:hypothetical protein